jgi:transglutaminase-like putative cysteine protease
MRRLALLLLCLPLLTAQTTKYRQWINGQELGGLEEQVVVQDGVQTFTSKEWLELNRLGLSVREEVDTLIARRADGAMRMTWRIKVAQDPLEGEATFDPKRPAVLHVQPKGGAAKELPVPEGALLWAPEFEARLKAAAAKGEGFTLTRFSVPSQEWGTVEVRFQGADPLPGHAKAVRFAGWERMGKTSVPVEFWVEAERGLLKERSRLGALEVLVQTADLPSPGGVRAGDDLFANALKTLPAQAFLPWLPGLDLRQTGGEPIQVVEDAQCRAVAPGHWRLRRADAPSAEEAAERPVKGTPSPEDAPFLAPSPLLQFNDPAFDGLLLRLAPKADATRWALAQAVTRFVFEWITDKDYSVGFASALEVARRPKGDCTEHGVLAVALLRKLGVPARGAVGWVALDRTLGPHFWVEVKLGKRWIPVDPTFDEAPASAFRLKLSETDLADLGGVGWETAQVLGDSTLVPTWPAPVIEGDRLRTPDGLVLRWPKGQWRWVEGALALRTAFGRLDVRAIPRPIPAQVKEARLMQGPGGLRGWWSPSRILYLELPEGRWLQVQELNEGAAFDVLQTLQITSR